MRKTSGYLAHIDVLLALITYFALTGWRSRSPQGLARDLGLEEQRIQDALTAFPGLFRRGSVQETEAGPQHSYTLHARYARRRPRGDREDQRVDGNGFEGREPSVSDPTPEQDGRGEELDAETLRTLLDFVAQEARAEREGRQHRVSQLGLAMGVGIAAVASVVSAVIQAAS